MRPVRSEVTISPSPRTSSTGWRRLLTSSTILIGLINPLLCVLHCALVLHHASLDLPGDQRSRFYCDLPAEIVTAAAATPNKALAGPAGDVTTLFFGGTEGLPTGAGSLIPALALIAWGAARRHVAQRLRAPPPPVPPPRLPQGAHALT